MCHDTCFQAYFDQRPREFRLEFVEMPRTTVVKELGRASNRGSSLNATFMAQGISHRDLPRSSSLADPWDSGAIISSDMSRKTGCVTKGNANSTERFLQLILITGRSSRF